MKGSLLLDLQFDKGNGAVFNIEHAGQRIRCFLPQGSAFFMHKLGAATDFPALVERHERLVAEASLVNVRRLGVSADPWGNCIEDQDLSVAQSKIQGAI